MNSTVYFLGAGASKDAGVPLSAGLLLKIEGEVRTRRGRRELRRFLRSFSTSGDGARPSIVALISLIDYAIRNERPLDSYFDLDRLRRIRNDLVFEIANAVEPRRGSRVVIPEGAGDQPRVREVRVAGYYRQFVRLLVGRDRRLEPEADLPPGDVIVTTNYDMMVDRALYEAVYAAEEDRVVRSDLTDVYLGSDFRDPYDDTPAFSEPEMCIDLFKLHGSISWLYCPSCARIFVSAVAPSTFYLEKPKAKAVVSELTCFCGYYPLEPVIVAPSAVQDIENLHLQAIWFNAYMALEGADHWVFAGYSLPPEDIAIRAMLHRAREARSRGPTITVVAPRLDDEDWRRLKARYRSFFGPGLKHVPLRFRDYVQTVARQSGPQESRHALV